MKNFKNKIIAIFFVALHCALIQSHDLLLEVKGAYFLSSDETFRNIYDNGCGEFGLEFTGNITEHVYGFLSVDFFNKTGATPTFETTSKFNATAFGIGLKYFIPCDHVDFYFGLGAQPTYLKTVDSSPFVPNDTSAWSFGGIGKFGAIIDLSHSLFLDLFIDYSFVTFDFSSPIGAPVQRHNAHLNGALFGVGFGYRFN